MNKYFLSLLTFSVFTNVLLADDIEEVVVTSSFVDSSEITNPLYVIDGDDINDASFVKNEVPLPGKNYGIKFRLSY